MAVLIASGALYVCTCAPGVLWQDSSLLAWRIWRSDVQGDMGLALAHPLYIMMGVALKRIPLGELFYRLNLLSAVLGAVAVANLFLLLRLWLGRVLPAVIGAVTLAVSWTFWWHAVVAEIYTLYAAQMLGELIFLLQYVRTKKIGHLYLLGFLNGLSVANHMWAIFGLACYGVFVLVLLARRQIGWRQFAIFAILWVLGAAPYEYLIIKDFIQTGSVQATLASAVFGNLWRGAVLNMRITSKVILENFIFILYNFPTPNFILFFAGLWFLRKKVPAHSFAYILYALMALYFVFAFRYTVVDRYAFFLPFYCLAAALVGVGADWVLQRYRRKAVIFAVFAFALLPAPVYSVTLEIAREHYKGLGERRQRPYRDEYKYFLQPWKAGYTGAQRFCDETFDIVENDAIIYADSTIIHTLLYVQEAQGKRPDVKIVSDYYKGENAPNFNEQTIGQLMKEHAIYVVSAARGYCPDFILDNYDTVQKGVLYRVVERKSAASPT
jgi:hypothetical protein